MLKASTATFAKFLLFDAVNIYYNNTLYFSINATNAAAVGFTPSTFFAGKSTDTNFAGVAGKLAGTEPFSTVSAKLYIASFQGDFSYLAGTVVDDKGVEACKLFFTSLNEAVCRLDAGATEAAQTQYYLILKNAAKKCSSQSGVRPLLQQLCHKTNC